MISLKNGFTGSGFYVNNGKEVYLVTAKHVLFDESKHTLLDPSLELLSYSKDPADPSPNLIALDLTTLQANGQVMPHPSQDVAVVKLFNATANAPNPSVLSPIAGVTVRTSAKLGVITAALDIIEPFQHVLIGNDVMMFGYPNSLGLPQIPQLDYNRPLLRKGIVAGFNLTKKSIILDCPVYYGNSGGPVLEADRGTFDVRFKIIGVISQFVPFVDSASSRTGTFAMQMTSNSGY